MKGFSQKGLYFRVVFLAAFVILGASEMTMCLLSRKYLLFTAGLFICVLAAVYPLVLAVRRRAVLTGSTADEVKLEQVIAVKRSGLFAVLITEEGIAVRCFVSGRRAELMLGKRIFFVTDGKGKGYALKRLPQ